MFEKAWYIGTFAKIPVKIHWTFWLIFILFGSMVFSRGGGWEDILVEFVFVLSVFICVILHEYGHALTARTYGIQTEDIIILPLGGVARLRNMPDKPIRELIIAIMGPMVNVVLALIIFLILWFTIGTMGISNSLLELQNLENGLINWRSFLPLLMITNIGLLVFNMAPAFPMDGGRVLRALLSMKWGRLRATRWASWIGQFVCILFIFYGFYAQAYTLALIGVMIYFFGNQEYKSVLLDESLKNKTLRHFVRQPQTTLLEYSSTEDAINTIRHTAEKSFIVINLSGKICGSVTARDIAHAFKLRPSSKIGEYYKQEYVSMHPDTPLLAAFAQIQRGSNLIIVEENNQVVGLIDEDTIQQAIELGV